MNRMLTPLAALATLSTTALAQLDAGDIVLDVQNAKIVTGSGFDAGGTFQPRRVFVAEFGAVFPDTTDEPGFDCEPFTFPAFTTNTFRIRDSLRRWNNSDFGALSPSQLDIAFSTLSVQTPQTPGTVDGFALSVASNGTWHRHFDYTLLSPATNGVYLLQLSMASSDPSIQESDPFWIVFGQNVDTSILTAAYTWARDTLPGTPPCTDIDFNNDGLFPDTQDIADLIAVFGGARTAPPQPVTRSTSTATRSSRIPKTSATS